MINKMKVQAIYDTGASKSVISEAMAKSLDLKVNQSAHPIKLADGSVCSSVGWASASVTIANVSHSFIFKVLKNVSHGILIGLDVIFFLTCNSDNRVKFL